MVRGRVASILERSRADRAGDRHVMAGNGGWSQTAAHLERIAIEA